MRALVDGFEVLTAEWERLAGMLEDRGATEAAASTRACARDARAKTKEYLDQPLLLSEAEREFRWSARYLREQVRAGELRAVDGEGPIRVRRRHLIEFQQDS